MPKQAYWLTSGMGNGYLLKHPVSQKRKLKFIQYIPRTIVRYTLNHFNLMGLFKFDDEECSTFHCKTKIQFKPNSKLIPEVEFSDLG